MRPLPQTTLYPTNNPIGDLVRSHFPAPLSDLVNGSLAIFALIALAAITPVVLIWLERKVCAHFQARLGPMRVGWHGLLQPLADGLKLLFKEILKPEGADTFLFFLAPILPATASFLVLTVIPFDHHLQVTDLDAGVLFVIAASGLSVFGVLLAGWASNNKYSLLGGIRSGAQMISFEISMALIMLLIVLLSGTASLRGIVLAQQGTILDWWIFKFPLFGLAAFVMFLISSTAELNRGPFDIVEAESELTGGFTTEYSGISFAKSYGVIFLYMWFRWTFPRPRIDQLMLLEWKVLLPINLLLLIVGGIGIAQGWIL